MTRVSLREAYDNKDVVAQIYAIRDTAESAVDTSEQAVTTANTASDHVDALVPQVEGAVANANSASASAQASAQTVAGYENRLGAVETGLSQTESDLNAVTLRITTAEGNIVTIQGRVTALETADGQNVKISRINEYAIGLTGNQEYSGIKKALTYTLGAGYGIDAGNVASVNDSLRTHWFKAFEITVTNRATIIDIVGSLNNTGFSVGKFVLINTAGDCELIQIYNKYRYTPIIVCATRDSSGNVALWVNEGQYIAFKINIEGVYYGSNVYGSENLNIIDDVSLDHKPTISDGYTVVKDCVSMNDVVIS